MGGGGSGSKRMMRGKLRYIKGTKTGGGTDSWRGIENPAVGISVRVMVGNAFGQEMRVGKGKKENTQKDK